MLWSSIFNNFAIIFIIRQLILKKHTIINLWYFEIIKNNFDDLYVKGF